MSSARPQAPLSAPPARPTGSAETKDRLLDAAERLFADRGYEGASLRAVTQEAGTSVSAANYHFGSKEALLRATLARRIAPLNAARNERLEALLAATPAPRVEELVDVFLRPLFEVRAQRAREGVPADHYRRVAARLFIDPLELMSDMKRELFADWNARFVDALLRCDAAGPGVGRAEAELALQLTVGVMVHVISSQLETLPGSAASTREDFEPLLSRMSTYAVAGIRALFTAAADAPHAPLPNAPASAPTLERDAS